MGKVKFTIVLFLFAISMCGLYAQDKFSEGDFRYTVENGTASVTDYTGDAENLIIPEKLGDYEVTNIEKWSFSYCEILTTIKIPDSVTSIGKSAFSGCENLTMIDIPDSVTSIGAAAFAECESLIAIGISKNNPVYSFIEGVLFDKQQKLLHTYLGSNKIISYVIPHSITSIGSFAFVLSHLTTIEIPNTVTSIGEGAFGLSHLTAIEIPDSVTSIGKSAFSGCESLSTIKIPDSVTSIGENAFEYCPSLIITIETENSYLHKYARENNTNYVFTPDTSWLN